MARKQKVRRGLRYMAQAAECLDLAHDYFEECVGDEQATALQGVTFDDRLARIQDTLTDIEAFKEDIVPG